MSRFQRSMYFGLVVPAMLLAGCGWFGGGSPLTSDDSLLRYVPADTPYVVASVDPYPDDFMNVYSEQLAAVRTMVELAMQAAIEEIGDSADAEILAILGELTSPETLQATGIDRDSTHVFYGFGLLPVFRITLAEGHDMGSVLDRVGSMIQQYGDALVGTASVAGQEYRYFGDDEARIVVALLENEMVLTIVPAIFGDDELQTILGVELPEQSIAESGRLEQIADEYGFTSNMIGMVDVERIAATFLEEPGATDAMLLSLMGYQAQGVSAACRNEFRIAAGVAPSLVGGYTELSASAMAMNLVVELREDIALGLAGIPGSAPGLGAETDAMISFGMSFDLPAVRQFLAARLAAIRADPFECEAFAGVEESFASAEASLNQPLLPIIDTLKGFSATLDFGEFDFSSPAPIPEDMAVSVLLATDDAAGALAMASAFVPQVAALNLPMDGNIVELDLPPPYNDPAMNPFGAAFFVATDTSIGVGLGQNGETRLGELMGSPPGDPSTFLHTSVDMAAYYGLMADAMDNVGVLGAPGAPPMAFVSSISGMMRSMQDFYSRETVDVRFTERGIEIPVRLELAR